MMVTGATPAWAQAPSSLNGERFQGAEFLYNDWPSIYPGDGSQPVGCNPNGTSRIEFTETGVATGPYPGTFTEHVTVVLGPQSPQGGASQPGILVGDIISFHAEFEIDSPLGDVTGTKTLAPKRSENDYITNEGSCFSASAPDGTEFGYPYLDDFTFANRSVNAYLTYEATIETADGTYRDEGNAWARFDEGGFKGYCNDLTNPYCAAIQQYDPTGTVHNGFYSQGGFQEMFFNSQGVEPAEQDPATVELTPAAATNDVGTEHCVTATVRDDSGSPVPNVDVVFAVEGSTSAEGTVNTANDGTAEFCYDGPPLPGQDVITAFADTDGDGQHDTEEPAATATKTWVFPTSTAGCEVSIHNGGWIIAANGDRATFGGNAKLGTDDVETGEQQYVDHGPANPMKLHSLEIAAVVCSSSRAEIYGVARVDDVPGFSFRIRVTDAGEPSTADTYGITVSNGYESGEQPLEGGNINIRNSN